MNQHHLLVLMMMRRVRHSARRQFGHMQFDGQSGVSLDIKDGPGYVLPTGMDREILKTIGIRSQGRFLSVGRGGAQGWK